MKIPSSVMNYNAMKNNVDIKVSVEGLDSIV